jgi:predicted RNase H-like HicB family nuclease
MRIEIEREEDGRWIAEVPDLPGVMVYGRTRREAVSKVEALALRVIADRLEHGEAIPELNDLFAVPPCGKRGGHRGADAPGRGIPFAGSPKDHRPGKLAHTLVFEKDIVSPLGEEDWEACR